MATDLTESVTLDVLKAYKQVVALGIQLDNYSWENLGEIKKMMTQNEQKVEAIDENYIEDEYYYESSSYSNRRVKQHEIIEETISYHETYLANTKLLYTLDIKDYLKVMNKSKDLLNELMTVWKTNYNEYDITNLFDINSTHFDNLFIMRYQYSHCGCQENWISFFDLFLGNIKLKIFYDYIPETCMNDPEYTLHKISTYVHDIRINQAAFTMIVDFHGLSMDLHEIIMDYLPATIEHCLYYKQERYKAGDLFENSETYIKQYVYNPDHMLFNGARYIAKRLGVGTMEVEKLVENLIEMMHRFMDSKEMMGFRERFSITIEEEQESEDEY